MASGDIIIASYQQHQQKTAKNIAIVLLGVDHQRQRAARGESGIRRQVNVAADELNASPPIVGLVTKQNETARY
jgi:hypothetical protein